MEKLSEWASRLNGRDFREELTEDEEKELRRLGVVVLWRKDEFLFSVRGAMSAKLYYLNDLKPVYVEEVGVFVYSDYYERNWDELIQIDLSKRPYIEIFPVDGNWKCNIPITSVKFNILKDGNQYFESRIFYKKDFVNFRKGMR